MRWVRLERERKNVCIRASRFDEKAVVCVYIFRGD